MEREQLLKGSLCMTFGFFFMALLAAFFKAALVGTSSVWTIFIAYSFACLIQYAVLYRKGLIFLKTKRVGGHLARVIFGFVATVLYVIALNEIPIMNATLLFNTAPLFVPLLAIYMLRSKIHKLTWVSLILGFTGVVIILRPEVASFTNLGNLLALSAGFVQAIAFIFVKKLTTTEPVRRINFYFFFLSSCILGPIAFALWPIPPLQSWIYSLCAGVMAFLAQLCIVKGYHFADASHVGPFQYTAVVVTGFIGWLIWNQTPDMIDILGTILVVSGGISAIIFYRPPRTVEKF